MKSTRFLLVDDELPNIRILERMLEKLNCFEVHSTTKSNEAADLFQSLQPGIVLLDLMMPGLSGFEVMEQLKPLIPQDSYIPIVILTADLTAKTKRKALAAGARDFLTKPFDPVELSLRLFNLVETRHYYLELQQERNKLEEAYRQINGARRTT